VTADPPFELPAVQVKVIEVDVLRETTSVTLTGASECVIITAPLPGLDVIESP